MMDMFDAKEDQDKDAVEEKDDEEVQDEEEEEEPSYLDSFILWVKDNQDMPMIAAQKVQAKYQGFNEFQKAVFVFSCLWLITVYYAIVAIAAWAILCDRQLVWDGFGAIFKGIQFYYSFIPDTFAQFNNFYGYLDLLNVKTTKGKHEKPAEQSEEKE